MTVGGRTLFGLSGTEGFSWSASYGYLQAEYESDFDLVSDGNDSRTAVTNSYSGFETENFFEDGAVTELGTAVGNQINSAGITDVNLVALETALLTTQTESSISSALETLEDNNQAVGSQNSVINVKKGDKMPAIPDHSLKLRLAYAFNQEFRVGTNIVAYSDTYMMGNENNEHGNTGGDGKVPGYAIVNLDAKYQFNPEWSLDFKAINVFDKTYYTGGRLLINGFTGDGKTARSSLFRGEGLAPGSPQAGWITLNYVF